MTNRQKYDIIMVISNLISERGIAMKNDELKTKAEIYLEERKYDPNIKFITSKVNSFLKWYEEKGIPIEKYTSENFEEYLEKNSSNVDSSKTNSSFLATFFDVIGYKDVSEAARSSRKSYKMKYFLTFEDMDCEIEKARILKHPILKDSPKTNVCDSLTVSQVISYLAWIGVPQEYLVTVPLSAINVEEKYVDCGRKYSYANNSKIAEVFEKYKNAGSYINEVKRNGKMVSQINEYRGDRLVRTRTEPNENGANIQGAINRLKANIKNERFTYFNITRSGQFYRGFENMKQGIIADFRNKDRDSIWECFQVWLESDSSINSFQIEWENFLKWRRTL